MELIDSLAEDSYIPNNNKNTCAFNNEYITILTITTKTEIFSTETIKAHL